MVSSAVGNPVTGKNLYGRGYELKELWRRLANGEHVLMLAPRRVGKSSLMWQLEQEPKPGWTVFYSDLEKGTEATDCVADMIAHLACSRDTRTLLDSVKDAIPFRKAIGDLIGRVDAVDVQGMRVELRQAMADGWRDTADQLQARLRTLPEGRRILFILDELPILFATILKRPDRLAEATALLAWLRAFRLDRGLKGRVTLLIGGSIGMQSLLRRHGLSAPINDLNPMRIDPWPPEVAAAFLKAVGESEEFSLEDGLIAAMLDRLGECVPYHVQLLFQGLRDECRGEVTRVDEPAIDRAFRDRLSGPHMDHYKERLEIMLPEEELALALGILEAASRAANGVDGATLATLDTVHGQRFRDVLRMLREDGYLTDDDGPVRFRSHLLRAYWRRHQTSPERAR